LGVEPPALHHLESGFDLLLQSHVP
jgi:hypothetical protein